MATRRIARALAAFGGSLSNIADRELQNKLILERQDAENRAIADRQKAQFERERVSNLTDQLRQGMIQPGQLTDSERAGMPTDLLSLTPPNSVLSGDIFKNIAAAKNVGDIGSDRELFEQRRAKGPIKSLTDITSITDAAAAGRQRVSDATAFAADAKGAEAYNTAYNTGMANEEVESSTHPAVMERKGKEADLAVKTAGRTAGAQEQSRLNVQFSNFKKILDMETQKAEALAAIETDKNNRIAGLTAVRKAQEGSTAALPRLVELYTTWQKAKPVLQKMMPRIPGAEAAMETRAKFTYMGMPQEVSNYYRLRDQSLPWIARIQGEVGNLAEQEQVRQMFGLPSAYDVSSTNGENLLEGLIALGIAGPELARLNQNVNIISLPPAQKLQILNDVVGNARKQTAELLRNQGTDAGRQALIDALNNTR